MFQDAAMKFEVALGCLDQTLFATQKHLNWFSQDQRHSQFESAKHMCTVHSMCQHARHTAQHVVMCWWSGWWLWWWWWCWWCWWNKEKIIQSTLSQISKKDAIGYKWQVQANMTVMHNKLKIIRVKTVWVENNGKHDKKDTDDRCCAHSNETLTQWN